MKQILAYVLILGSFSLVFSQSGGYNSYNYGTRNYASGTNSFKYGIIGSNQDATGSPVGIVSAIVRRVPSAKKLQIDLVTRTYHLEVETLFQLLVMKYYGILMGLLFRHLL